MQPGDRARRQLATLLVAAIAALVVRVVAAQFGAPAAVDQGLYAVAIACLVGCVLVLFRESRS
ncbi:hypothetical protein HWV23_16290 [Natronomonas halophila]|uniref:hypothetical protein n=1 Tax=Natronomonas halophila TaxID=2747817 RepID=UPI0015B44CB7|nr:hypothetical protein [Natronomonas halophila]QLD87215.1 hypothetical protein HWV23_16290 [Natronomonas halophila]